MIKKRILIALICLIDFILFLAVVIGSVLILFHIAVLAIPLWAAIWTLFIFDIIWLITLKYNLKKRIIWSAISAFYAYFLLVGILSFPMLKEKFNPGTLSFVIINCVIAVLLGIYVVVNAIQFIKWLSGYIKSIALRTKNIVSK